MIVLLSFRSFQVNKSNPVMEPDKIDKAIKKESGLYAKRKALLKITVLDNPYIPVVPFPNQAILLVDSHTEILFGGSAGGGKVRAC